MEGIVLSATTIQLMMMYTVAIQLPDGSIIKSETLAKSEDMAIESALALSPEGSHVVGISSSSVVTLVISNN